MEVRVAPFAAEFGFSRDQFAQRAKGAPIK